MSAQGTPPAPAGWYPDPQNPAQGRYWDGANWTDLRHQPGAASPPAAPLRAPEGTDWNTPWIWLVVLLPLVPGILTLFLPWGSMFDVDLSDPRSAFSTYETLFGSPLYWLSIVLSYGIYGLNVFFAYRDHRQLLARGVPLPFHWAYGFLALLAPVYPIGRAIVTKRRTGHGSAVLWVTVGGIVAAFVVAIVIVAIVVAQVFESVARMPGVTA